MTDEWCRFLKKHNFLVGISLDGPRDIHDAYRHDRAGAFLSLCVPEGLDMLRPAAPGVC